MAKFQEQYIVDKKRQKTAVILPVKKYEELLEDLHDLAIIAERRNEPTISFEELKKRLKESGLSRDSMEKLSRTRLTKD
jgi:PHD/YefM family antitoxin component YafN of YafNO toxin-antitoxin module